MTQTPETQPWVPLEGPELLQAVRDIIADETTRRWDQSLWFGNVFYWDPRYNEATPTTVAVDEVRGYAATPVPEAPLDWQRPTCGSTGCAAGWGAILGAPDGTDIDTGNVYLPNGGIMSIFAYAAERFGISWDTAEMLFAPGNSREFMLAAFDVLISDPRGSIFGIGQDGVHH